jgi:hypothetical protein
MDFVRNIILREVTPGNALEVNSNFGRRKKTVSVFEIRKMFWARIIRKLPVICSLKDGGSIRILPEHVWFPTRLPVLARPT